MIPALSRQATLDDLLNMAVWNYVFLSAGDEDSLRARISELLEQGARFRANAPAPIEPTPPVADHPAPASNRLR